MGSNKYIFLTAILLICFLLSILVSCEKDQDEIDDTDTTNITNTEISQWIYEWMHDVYYWNSTLPSNITIQEETNPEDFFYKLIYDTEDKWSFITDDFKTLEAELNGTPMSMGYSPAFGVFENSDRVFIVVEYVYPNSPSDQAGLKRGNIILTIDDEELDTTNYYELYSQTSYTVELGTYLNGTIYRSGNTISMSATVIDANPLIYDTIFEISGTKIGYIVYTEFTTGDNDKYLETIGSVFDGFKNEGVTELIVDLRYNPGGEIDASAYLASAIVPAKYANHNYTFTTFQYNDLLQAYYEYNEGSQSENLVYKLSSNTHNLNLSSVCFLTTAYTASASELLIAGLDPYMEVTIIGDPTYGKYTGAWVIYDLNEPREHNWGIIPVVLKYANANGYTDFVDGLTPTYKIEDNLIEAKAFGDTDDDMLAYAIEVITGEPLKSTKISQKKGFIYKRLDNKKDIAKRNLYVPYKRDMP